MENLSLIESFSEFKDEKFIDRVTLMSILEEVFRNTLKRKYGDDDNFDIIINPDKGDLEIWRNRIVVEDGAVEDENQEISITEARKIEPDFEVGEDVSEEVKLVDLGRRTVLSLRQNLISRILELEKDQSYRIHLSSMDWNPPLTRNCTRSVSVSKKLLLLTAFWASMACCT